MVIRASSSRQIDALIADLESGDPLRRDAAVARLILLGSRAVQRLASLATSRSSGAARTAAFRALEAIDDPRALSPALQAVADADPSVASAAIAVVRTFLRGERGADAVDRLTTTALDRSVEEPIRIAAVRALRDLDRRTIAPLLKTLSSDPSPAIRAAAAPPKRRSAAPAEHPIETIGDAAGVGLPDDPRGLHAAIASTRDGVPLTALFRIVERVCEREAAEPAAVRGAWMEVRAAAHLALAERRSKVALYDLRESIAAAERPLPTPFVAALTLIGDASCLEAIATAYARSTDAAWRKALGEAFQSIAKRERLTRRHAVMKRIEQRWPETFAKLRLTPDP